MKNLSCKAKQHDKNGPPSETFDEDLALKSNASNPLRAAWETYYANKAAQLKARCYETSIADLEVDNGTKLAGKRGLAVSNSCYEQNEQEELNDPVCKMIKTFEDALEDAKAASKQEAATTATAVFEIKQALGEMSNSLNALVHVLTGNNNNFVTPRRLQN
jgi:hypothetical protein